MRELIEKYKELTGYAKTAFWVWYAISWIVVFMLGKLFGLVIG